MAGMSEKVQARGLHRNLASLACKRAEGRGTFSSELVEKSYN